MTLGVLGTFAVIFQPLLTALLTLSLIERVMLGACAFLVALGLVLVIYNYVLKRRTSAQEREKPTLQQDKALKQLDTEELHKRFYAQPLQKVSEAAFVNERVSLDGFHYDHCTFERCTFVYRGENRLTSPTSCAQSSSASCWRLFCANYPSRQDHHDLHQPRKLLSNYCQKAPALCQSLLCFLCFAGPLRVARPGFEPGTP